MNSTRLRNCRGLASVRGGVGPAKSVWLMAERKERIADGVWPEAEELMAYGLWPKDKSI